MQIIPAIDVLKGRAVRLVRGELAHCTDVGDPVELANRFYNAGATKIHLVDLDAAFDKPRQAGLLQSISQILPVQCGGGVRCNLDVRSLLSEGATQVVVGTWAHEHPIEFGDMARVMSSQLIVAADVKDGCVVTRGWTETTCASVEDYIAYVASFGVKQLLVTAVNRDGTLLGADVALYQRLVQMFPHVEFLASGGVSSMDDLKKLQATGVHGAIVGKAIYSGNIPLETLWKV